MKKFFDVIIALIAVLMVLLAVKFQVNAVESQDEPTEEVAISLRLYIPVDDVERQVQTDPVEPTPYRWTEEEVIALTKMLWGEAGAIQSDTEKSAVIWTVLNRQDMYGEGIVNIVTMPMQYVGYRSNNPVDDHLRWLVEDVLSRWCMEKDGIEDSGRTLPSDYIYFSGDGYHNHFRNKFEGGVRWDWSLPSPYST